MMKGCNVYSCMLDASKDFDRVNFGALLGLLLERNLPLGIVRLLPDSYTHHACSLQYGNNIHFLLIFTIYINQLLLRLKNSGSGCHLHGKYM